MRQPRIVLLSLALLMTVGGCNSSFPIGPGTPTTYTVSGTAVGVTDEGVFPVDRWKGWRLIVTKAGYGLRLHRANGRRRHAVRH